MLPLSHINLNLAPLSIFLRLVVKVPVVLSVQCLEEVFDVWLWFFLGDKDHTKGVFGVETDILAALVVELRD